MHFNFGVLPTLATLSFVLLLLATSVLAVAGGARALRQRQRRLPSPVRVMPASIALKRAAMLQNWHTFSESSLSARASLVYYVTFQLEDGTQLEFPVQKTHYLALRIGDTGWLTVRDTQYLGFEHTGPSEDVLP